MAREHHPDMGERIWVMMPRKGRARLYTSETAFLFPYFAASAAASSLAMTSGDSAEWNSGSP